MDKKSLRALDLLAREVVVNNMRHLAVKELQIRCKGASMTQIERAIDKANAWLARPAKDNRPDYVRQDDDFADKIGMHALGIDYY